MIPVCLYFQVHQPYRLRRYNYFDVGREHRYFDEVRNGVLLRRVAEKCYLPATAMLARLLARHPRFAVSFSLSGCLLEQLRDGAPDVLDAFRSLAADASGRVELLAETSHHSLAWLASREEFAAQIALHRGADRPGLRPGAARLPQHGAHLFRRARARAGENGYAGVLADGVAPLLGDRSPHHVYRAATPKGLPLLLRDYRLSDDIAFRFSNASWSEYPLTPEKYARWIAGLPGELLSLFMDFETFGEHQWKETGIFEFFEGWVSRHLARRGARFVTPSDAIAALPCRDELSAPGTLSWADEARDVSAWQGNDLQKDALKKLFGLEARIRSAASEDLQRDFRRLSTSDHFYYMATKSAADGDVHAYFSPYESPYEAYMAFMHVVSDLERRLPRAARARGIHAEPPRPVPHA